MMSMVSSQASWRHHDTARPVPDPTQLAASVQTLSAWERVAEDDVVRIVHAVGETFVGTAEFKRAANKLAGIREVQT